MVREIREDRAFWVGYLVLLLVGVFLGLRSERTIAAVLAAHKLGVACSTPTTQQSTFDPVRLSLRDSLLVQAQPTVRDPFHAPPAKQQPRRVETRPALPEIPSLRALLYDKVNPSAKISIGSSLSGWLHEGDQFRGWTVADITPTSVWVSKESRVYVIRPQ